MASLRRYDVQARVSFALVWVAVLPTLVAMWLVWRNYHADIREIVYRSKSYALALMACIGFGGLIAGIACVLGYNSAGEARNDQSKRSWFAFFLGGGLVTLNIIIFLGFAMLRSQMK